MKKQEKQGPQMTVAEAGRRGGTVVKERYGQEFFSKIGREGGAAVREKYGQEFFSEIGQKGGEARRENLGREGYAAMGRRGGEARAAAAKEAKEPHGENPGAALGMAQTMVKLLAASQADCDRTAAASAAGEERRDADGEEGAHGDGGLSE